MTTYFWLEQELVLQNDNQYYTSAVTTKINKDMEELVDRYTKMGQVSTHQAAAKVKHDIIEETVEPGFLASLGGWISKSASAVKDACALM